MQDLLEQHLDRTSRTFALAIPMLPPRMSHEVGVAYLLFRVADTLEDASRWCALARLEALADFVALLEGLERPMAEELASRWTLARPVEHEGYQALLRSLPELIDELWKMDAESREVIVMHARRTALGMAQVIARSQGGAVALQSVDDLRSYCYIVAGIVGEMLTELFLLHEPWLLRVAPVLRSEAPRFGEGLQLVNILKDARDDAAEGRAFLPRGVDIAEIRELAREGLNAAERYAYALEEGRASRGIISFVATPVTLAQATLREEEKAGPGAKISRAEVARCVSSAQLRVERGISSLDQAA